MDYEKSCGALVFRKFHGNVELLLIRHMNGGYWSFPKGHVEQGETEEETAIREVKEEPNIDIMLDTSFREMVTYSPKKDTMKDVVYFLARAKNFDPFPQEGEISEVKWAEINLAQSILTYDNDKQLVSKAKLAIKERG